MYRGNVRRGASLVVFTLLAGVAVAAHAKGDLRKVKHVIIVMQENHSFDNYFGVLPYVPDGPYHAGPCNRNDHRCVDGLTCDRRGTTLQCKNSNPDPGAPGGKAFSFNSSSYCTFPDLNHEWPGSHREANFEHPKDTLRSSPNDGFVRVNDATVGHRENEADPEEDETMGYYDQDDLPFYYSLAQTFAISDRYFSSVLGPTFPNRAYTLAATSFGHLTTDEIFPPPGGYRPITGTIMDLLDENDVSWKNFFSNLPTTGIFRDPAVEVAKQRWVPVDALRAFAPPKPPPGSPNAPSCLLPAVSFVDPLFGLNAVLVPIATDEHPPSSIRRGESFVSQVVNTIRQSVCWDDSVIFITYDEHGGFYDHVAPARAPQGGAPNPDGIDPGLCADASLPGSEQPGAGQNCVVSKSDAKALCPEFNPAAVHPTYPASCPNFDQLGFRVPFMAVSPFSEPRYVSHVVADHTSMLAFIEKRFLGEGRGGDGDHEDDRHDRGTRAHLTLRDLYATTLEDLFDFDRAPSRDATVLLPEHDVRCRQ